jgi:hypothetical protein
MRLLLSFLVLMLACPAAADLVVVVHQDTQLSSGIRVEPHGNGTLIYLSTVYSRGNPAATQPSVLVVQQVQQVHIQQPRHYRHRRHHQRPHVRPVALPVWPVGVSQLGQGRER